MVYVANVVAPLLCEPDAVCGFYRMNVLRRVKNPGAPLLTLDFGNVMDCMIDSNMTICTGNWMEDVTNWMQTSQVLLRLDGKESGTPSVATTLVTTLPTEFSAARCVKRAAFDSRVPVISPVHPGKM